MPVATKEWTNITNDVYPMSIFRLENSPTYHGIGISMAKVRIRSYGTAASMRFSISYHSILVVNLRGCVSPSPRS